MITELRIRGLGVIADAVVPFAPGLTVVTGETGAGKTMVLTGLGLVSGERADPGLVRTGSERADVDAEWRLEPATLRTLASRLEDAGVDLSRPVITTCGSGVTAASLFLALERIGQHDHSLYDGSWAEWGSFPDLKIATGDA